MEFSRVHGGNGVKQKLTGVFFAIVAAVLWLDSACGSDKVNTAYISTTPGSSSVIWVAKDAKIFDKHGIDATVIFISGSVRGIQSILAGEILIGDLSKDETAHA